MNDRLLNRLGMIGACINTANDPKFLSAWSGKPIEFGEDLAALTAKYAAASALSATLPGAPSGVATAKDTAETALERLTHKLARALVIHFKRGGNLADLAKVNVSLNAVQKLRDQELVTFATEVSTLAKAASANPDSLKRGITAERIATLTAANERFSQLLSQPRATIVTRATVRRELQTLVAGLVEMADDLDDLVLQLDEDETGHAFRNAWRRARIGAGGGAEEEKEGVIAAAAAVDRLP